MFIERYINGQYAGTEELKKFEIRNDTISQTIREVNSRIDYGGYFSSEEKHTSGSDRGYKA